MRRLLTCFWRWAVLNWLVSPRSELKAKDAGIPEEYVDVIDKICMRSEGEGFSVSNIRPNFKGWDVDEQDAASAKLATAAINPAAGDRLPAPMALFEMSFPEQEPSSAYRSKGWRDLRCRLGRQHRMSLPGVGCFNDNSAGHRLDGICVSAFPNAGSDFMRFRTVSDTRAAGLNRAEVLRRANTLGSAVFGEGAACWLTATLWRQVSHS